MERTSIERIHRAVSLQEPDVVPVAPYMGNHGAKVAGALIDEYCTNSKIMAQAQFKAWEIYQQDVMCVQSDNYYIAEGFGIETEIRLDSTPTLKRPVLDDIKEVYKLKVPDPYKDGRMPVYLEAVNILANKTKNDGVCIRGTGTGPFSLASHLMGTENFLIQLATVEAEEDAEGAAAFQALMDLTSDALISFAKASLAAGANLVQCGDSLASINMISPKMYKKWAFPYEKKFFQAIKPECEKYGAFAILHICGNMTPVLDLLADTGADIVELDTDVMLDNAKARIGGRVCLMGNIHPTQVLLQGSPKEVEEACRQAIKDAGAGGGFILGSGCEVPPFAPQENIKAMIKTARSISYPLFS
jgi:uroporphyrinogen decarboxylase